MTALPNWVLDVIRDLIDQENHPKLLYTSGAFEGTAKYDWCPCNTLGKVPADVVAQARVLNDYLRASKVDWPQPTTTVPATVQAAGYQPAADGPFGPIVDPCDDCGCAKAWHGSKGCTGDFTKCPCREWAGKSAPDQAMPVTEQQPGGGSGG